MGANRRARRKILYRISMGNDDYGLKIILNIPQSTKRRIVILFSRYRSYIRTDESYRFRKIGELNELYGGPFYGKWTFFKVKNSDYLNWISH